MKKLLPKSALRLFSVGFAMGSADTVPGVSGGTMAFIFGVYEELIYSIKLLSGEIPLTFLRGKFVKAFKAIPFKFLIPLGLGLMFAIVTVAQVVEHFLETQPTLVWSFFFGLLVASIFIVRKRVKSWDSHDYTALAFSAVVAFLIAGFVPARTPETLIAFFLAGMIAIVAMILPGISGSFILILMGKYEQVLGAVNDRNIIVLITVAAGAVVGLALFSRVLSWLFAKHHDIVVASLTGFMIGSLRKVWPWQESLLPSSFDLELMLALVLMGIGVAIMIYFDRRQATVEATGDINKKFAKSHKKSVSSQKPDRI